MEHDDIVIPGNDSRHLSHFTVIYYQSLFRDLISDMMMDSSGGYMVGGPGTTIEIDESCFGDQLSLIIIVVLCRLDRSQSLFLICT